MVMHLSVPSGMLDTAQENFDWLGNTVGAT